MFACEICGKELRTAKGLSGHRQFQHKLLASGDKARPYAALATERQLDEAREALASEFHATLESVRRELFEAGEQLGGKLWEAAKPHFEQAFSKRDALFKQLDARVDSIERRLEAADERVLPILEMHEITGGLVVSGVRIGNLKREHTR